MRLELIAEDTQKVHLYGGSALLLVGLGCLARAGFNYIEDSKVEMWGGALMLNGAALSFLCPGIKKFLQNNRRTEKVSMKGVLQWIRNSPDRKITLNLPQPFLYSLKKIAFGKDVHERIKDQIRELKRISQVKTMAQQNGSLQDALRRHYHFPKEIALIVCSKVAEGCMQDYENAKYIPVSKNDLHSILEERGKINNIEFVRSPPELPGMVVVNKSYYCNELTTAYIKLSFPEFFS